MMKSSELRKVIDKMVAESIRRQLPEIMNEVLMKVVVNSGVLSEGRESPPEPQPVRRKQPKRPQSFRHLIDESAGADFFRKEEPPTPPPALARRITTLPPALQGLAQESLMDMMQEEAMMEAQDAIPDEIPNMGELDFSRMARVIQEGERRSQQTAPLKQSMSAEERRLQQLREKLDVKVTPEDW